jgi:hypothetical protein
LASFEVDIGAVHTGYKPRGKGKGKGKGGDDSKQRDRREVKCFACNGNHPVKDSDLLRRFRESNQSGNDSRGYVGSTQLG